MCPRDNTEEMQDTAYSSPRKQCDAVCFPMTGRVCDCEGLDTSAAGFPKNNPCICQRKIAMIRKNDPRCNECSNRLGQCFEISPARSFPDGAWWPRSPSLSSFLSNRSGFNHDPLLPRLDRAGSNRKQNTGDGSWTPRT